MALKDSFRQVARPRRYGNRRLAVLLLALGTFALLAGVVIGGFVIAGGDETPKSVPEASSGQPRQRVSFLSRIIPPKERPERRERTAPNVARSVQDLARRLPLERKVAQLFLVGFNGTDLTAGVFQQLRRLDLGGIVVGRSNYTNPGLLGQLAGEAVVVARKAKRVPPLVMASQEGGEFSSFPDLPPPHAPADLSSSRQGGDEAAQAAQALRALNVTGLLGPSIDVGVEDGAALGDRVFSDDASEVAGFADAVTRAYRRGFMFASPGHFPGLGSADVSTDEGPATVGLTESDLEQRDLLPFRAAIRAGAPAITLSHAVYSMDNFSVPGSLSRKVIEGLLRRKLGFKGVAITDDLADPPIASFASLPDAAVKAVRAGADMVYISGSAGDQRAAYVAVLRAVRRGTIKRSRLDQAVLRILEAKRNYRLIR
jgi:beta-N-acetylhexosaminidase